MKIVSKITFTFFLGVLSLQAQTKSSNEVTTPEPEKFNFFVEKVFNKTSNELKEEKSNYWKLLYNLYNNRITYVKMNQEPESYNFISSAPVYNKNIEVSKTFNPKNFNPLNYKLRIHNSKSVEYYKIYNTGYYMVIKPYDPSILK